MKSVNCLLEIRDKFFHLNIFWKKRLGLTRKVIVRPFVFMLKILEINSLKVQIVQLKRYGVWGINGNEKE